MNVLTPQQQGALWADAALAGALLALLGHGVGGVLLRARPGPVRDLWLAETRRLLAPQQPVRKIPLSCATDRLLGGLDLAATLRRGRPVLERGLLAECDGGIAILPMAERAEEALLAPLAAALDRGEVVLERDGVAARLPAAFAIIACDEGVDELEQLDDSLAERLALRVDLTAVGVGVIDDLPWSRADIAAAGERLAGLQLTDVQLEALCGATLTLGVHSPRAAILASRVACGFAALRGTAVDDAALEAAVRLVLLPRATQLPAPPEQEEQETAPPPEPPPPSGDESPADRDEPAGEGGLPAERLLDAAVAALPPALLEQLVARTRQQQRGAGGKSGAAHRHKLRGRPMGSTAGDPRRGARLDLIATLRAAAPWQRVRARTAGSPTGARVRVESGDFRVVRFRQRMQSVTVFVVDASGSSALYRLAEAKGAVELLLADCYVRRDEVALIAFRGEGAELLLPPTRSLLRAKRCLSALPGGGGTPLAAALDATGELLEQIARRGATPAYVLLTDGRANVARDGASGREAAAADALAAAAALRARTPAAGLLIDTSPRPHRSAANLAAALEAVYLPLPHADAAQLQAAVRGVTA